MGNTRIPGRADNLRRFLAAGCAALVFALGLFAASPLLHARLHHDRPADANDACTVVLFASGVSVALNTVAVAPPSTEWREQGHVSAAEVHLDSPRYMLQPERGPPVG